MTETTDDSSGPGLPPAERPRGRRRPPRAAPAPWDGGGKERRTYTSVLRVAVGAPVLIVVVVIVRVVGPRVPTTLVGAVVIFFVVVAVLAGLLAWVMRSAVLVAPTGAKELAEEWRGSQDRELSLARIQADVWAYCVLFAVAGAIGIFAACAYDFGGGRGASRIIAGAAGHLSQAAQGASTSSWGAVVIGALQPFQAGAFALAGIGALSFVTSAFKELAVMRAAVAYRQRQAEDLQRQGQDDLATEA